MGDHDPRATPAPQAGDDATPEHALDAFLVERARAGDQQAFAALVRKYQHRVAAVVGRFVRGDWAEVEDVSQDVFVRAWRALPEFRGDARFFTWLYRIAVNTAKNHLVARRRRPPTDDVDAADAEHLAMAGALHDVATPERELLRDEMEAQVMAAVDALPPELRRALTLREVDGLDYHAIAAAMDCPIGTVRSRIHRAREAIDARLRPLLDATGRVRP